MKATTIIAALAMTTILAAESLAAEFQPDAFKTKGGKEVVITAIKHASLRIYIAGDTEDIPEMAKLKDIDVAFLPCNQPYTMTPEPVAKAAKTIKPKVLFPYHYSETPIKRVVELLADTAIDVRTRNYR